jgi:DNA-directed RNA polymerase sigma subunit (sigma70/sigma32)
VLHRIYRREDSVLLQDVIPQDQRVQSREEKTVERVIRGTRERIRQIEAKTIAKLSNPSVSACLRDYIED